MSLSDNHPIKTEKEAQVCQKIGYKKTKDSIFIKNENK